jgi:hypothetical protein
MPFDGRLHKTAPAPLDEAGEIILPPELQSLAGQLTSAAVSLADDYPADRDDPADAPIPKRRWLGIMMSTVGAVLVVTACTLLVIFAAGLAPHTPHTPFNKNAMNTNTLNENTIPVKRVESPLHITPAMALPDVSSPELEGILDVLEDSTGQTYSISI